MDNLADAYMKEFSEKLKGFPEFYSRWWMFEKLMNNSLADVTAEDFAFWVFMQSFANNRVKELAETLPKEGKEKITDALKKAVEQSEIPPVTLE